MILPDALYLTLKSVVLAAADATVRPGVLQPWVDEILRTVACQGKFSKFAALYVPFAPPPVFWDYKCKKCRFWLDNNACSVVEGEIAPRAWCALWVPPEGYKKFSYFGEFLRGDW